MSIFSDLVSNTISSFNTVSKKLDTEVKKELFNLPDLVYPESLNQSNEGNTSIIMFTVLEVGGLEFEDKLNTNNGIKVEDDVAGRRIYLYMPEQVQDTLNSNWELDELGIVGRVSDVIGGSKGLADTIKNAVSSSTDSVVRGSSKFVGDTLGVNATGLRKFKTRKIINPFMELLFSNVENRQFNFSFKFTPRNAKEADVIQNIIKVFRMAAAPSFPNENRSFIRFPNLFGIKYIDAKSPNGTNKWLPKIGKCALTSVDTNYSGAGQYSTHHDGSPKEIHLTLQFTEIQWKVG